MRGIFSFLVLSFFYLGQAEATVPSHEEREYMIYAHAMQPCKYWTFSSTANGYVCTFTELRADLADARDTQRVVNALEKRILALEERVKKLEGEQEEK
jgi:hypothetical protein